MAAALPDRVKREARPFGGTALIACLSVLLVLTGLSWALSYAPLGLFHTPVALGIAALKATLVAAVFMELAHGSTAQRTILLVTVLFIALLATGMIADVALR